VAGSYIGRPEENPEIAYREMFANLKVGEIKPPKPIKEAKRYR
jgi:hypothetical protein